MNLETIFFLNEVVKLDNKQDIDIVFPVNENSWKTINRVFDCGSVITKTFENNDKGITFRYPSGSISGYIEVLGYRINLIGVQAKDIDGWKFATSIISKSWEHFPKLKYDKKYRVSFFKLLRAAK